MTKQIETTIIYPSVETFVRIKKDVRPYGGRRLRLAYVEVYQHRAAVRVRLGVLAPNSPAPVGTIFSDVRTYDAAEAEIIQTPTERITP